LSKALVRTRRNMISTPLPDCISLKFKSTIDGT
jgi:hypothetical protein